MKGEGWKEEQTVCKQDNVQGVEWKANKRRDKARDLNPGCYKSEQTWLEILRDSLLLLIPLTGGTVRLKQNQAQCVGWLEWQSSAWLMIKRNTTQLQQLWNVHRSVLCSMLLWENKSGKPGLPCNCNSLTSSSLQVWIHRFTNASKDSMFFWFYKTLEKLRTSDYKSSSQSMFYQVCMQYMVCILRNGSWERSFTSSSNESFSVFIILSPYVYGFQQWSLLWRWPAMCKHYELVSSSIINQTTFVVGFSHFRLCKLVAVSHCPLPKSPNGVLVLKKRCSSLLHLRTWSCCIVPSSGVKIRVETCICSKCGMMLGDKFGWITLLRVRWI